MLVQPPNTLLTVVLVAALAARLLRGRPAVYARALLYVASGAWAYDEMVWGVNRFRRLLGVAFLLHTGAQLVRRLERRTARPTGGNSSRRAASGS